MAPNARLDHRNPLVFDTHELGRRPGALQRLTRTIDAPKDLGVQGVIGVPEGAPVELELLVRVGLALGEWRGAARASLMIMFAGLSLLILGFCTLAWSSRLA